MAVHISSQSVAARVANLSLAQPQVSVDILDTRYCIYPRQVLVDSVLVCGGADTASCAWYWPAHGEGRPHAAPGPRMSRPRYQVTCGDL